MEPIGLDRTQTMPGPYTLERNLSLNATFVPLPPPILVGSRSGTPAPDSGNYRVTPVMPSPAATPGVPPIPKGRFARAPALRVHAAAPTSTLRHGPLALPDKTPVASPAPTPTLWPGQMVSQTAMTSEEGALVQVALADRKLAALEEWRTIGRELVSSAQRHFAAVKTTHAKSHSWNARPKVTCKGATLNLPPLTTHFRKDLFDVSVGSILPTLAERLAKKRLADQPADEDMDDEMDEHGDTDEANYEDEDKEDGSCDELDGVDFGDDRPQPRTVGERTVSAVRTPTRQDVELPGVLKITSIPRRAPLPARPLVSKREGFAGYFAFKRAKGAAEQAKVAEELAIKEMRTAAASEVEQEVESSRRHLRKKRKSMPSDDPKVCEAFRARKARKAVFDKIKAEWVALSASDAAEWASKEAEMKRVFEEATTMRNGVAPPPTEYTLKLRDPSIAQILMHLPVDGFRAFTTFGVQGQREQRASVKAMSLAYDVQQEQLTVSSCTVGF